MSAIDIGLADLDNYARRACLVQVRAFRDRWAQGRPVLQAIADQLLEGAATGQPVLVAWDPDAAPAATRSDRALLVEFARRRRDDGRDPERLREVWNRLLIAIDDERLDVDDERRSLARWYDEGDEPGGGSWAPWDE